MSKLFSIIGIILLFVGCSSPNNPEISDTETITYRESNKDFVNPERGFFSGEFYSSQDLYRTSSVAMLKYYRMNGKSLIFHGYQLFDYKNCDIPDAFLQRLEKNMLALRESGCKCILRFSYSDDNTEEQRPWDASPEIVSRHIDQLAPYLEEYADVIYCLQAGFIGSWGEWGYTDNFVQDPVTEEEYQLRKALLNHLLEVLPTNRQICVRTPYYKMNCLGLTYSDTLTQSTAHTDLPAARIAAHNDCFLSSQDDYGTYHKYADRLYWQQETKYTIINGETCACIMAYGDGPQAINTMEKYHFSALNDQWYTDLISYWRGTGYMDSIAKRLGYRLVLHEAQIPRKVKAGQAFETTLSIYNKGFASIMNPRDVELVFVSQNDSTQKYVYKQDIDPRFWMPASTTKVTLTCTLDTEMKGKYDVYLNLPDPCPTLYNNPLFSIRLANVGVWDETKGMNKLFCVIL